MCRRELPWAEANTLWDCLFAQHLAATVGHHRQCPACSPVAVDLTPGIGQHAPVHDDVLRALAVRSSVALFLSHRSSFLSCKCLEGVVQLSNRPPDLGAGVKEGWRCLLTAPVLHGRIVPPPLIPPDHRGRSEASEEGFLPPKSIIGTSTEPFIPSQFPLRL